MIIIPYKLTTLLADYGFECRDRENECPYQYNGFYVSVSDDGFVDCYKKVLKRGFTTKTDLDGVTYLSEKRCGQLMRIEFKDDEGLWNIKVKDVDRLTDYEICQIDKHMEGIGLISKPRPLKLRFYGRIKPCFVPPRPRTLTLNFKN